MGLPERLRTTIPGHKLRDYLLSTDHPVGRSKAAFFHSLGFRVDRPEALEAALHEHARDGMLVSVEGTPFGERFVVEGPMRATDARQTLIRSVWFRAEGDEVLLVTAYPLHEPRKPRMSRP